MQSPSLLVVVAVLLGCAAVIAMAGTRLARLAEDLAERTGWGQAVLGAVFVGASTSLPGSVLSIAAAARGDPGLAVGNGLGGILAQLVFLSIADLCYRKANLEHAAASAANLMQAALLMALLALPLIAAALGDIAVLGVSPVSLLLVTGYLFGLRLLRQSVESPMWQPARTRDTQLEPFDGVVAGDRRDLPARWMRFLLLGAVLGLAGYVLSLAGGSFAQQTGLTGTTVGAYFTAVITSLPELVVAVAAVRRGALNLAVGNILGGNCFDVLFLAASDVAYRPGSIYAVFTPADSILAAAGILMTAVLLLGLLHRQRHGPAGIGFESALIVPIYLLTVALTAG